MANDALIEEGNTQWWLDLIKTQERRRRRDNDLEDERADQPEEQDEWSDLRNDRSYCGVSDGIYFHPDPFLFCCVGHDKDD